ncbi:MAG: septum formation initiator family protein [Eubacteriales bacterium]|nr:septum formation initiator family protein [Eubacteriales bacterium]
MKKEKRARKNRNSLAILVVFVLIAVVGFELFQVYGKQLKDARAELKSTSAQLEQQQQENASLQADLDRADDPAIYKEKAREQLGLAEDGERIFYDVNN